MLQYSTIEPRTLELLRKLMAVDEFKDLKLVGGTSLALQIGHRISIDLDLFGILNCDEFEITEILSSIGQLTTLKKTKNINVFLIDGIKVDLVNYHYPWLKNGFTEDEIRLASIEDIVTMKLAAITGRGSKKDFIDLFFLLNHFSLSDMMNLYKLKYNDASEFLAIKSLTYFDDADSEESPIMLKPLIWEQTKEVITKNVQEYLTNFKIN